jgi:hypothetical protein
MPDLPDRPSNADRAALAQILAVINDHESCAAALREIQQIARSYPERSSARSSRVAWRLVFGRVVSTFFDPFRRLVKALEGLSIKKFIKSIKHPVCLIYHRCNTSLFSTRCRISSVPGTQPAPACRLVVSGACRRLAYSIFFRVSSSLFGSARRPRSADTPATWRGDFSC